MILAAETLTNVIVSGAIAMVSSISVAVISSRRVISSQTAQNEHLHRDLDINKDLITSLRDEVFARGRVMSQTIDRGVFETDQDGSCVFVNRMWAEITGVHWQEALGNGWMRGVHPEDEIRVRLAWRAAVSNQEPFGPISYRWITSKSSIVSLHAEAYPMRNGGGRLRGYLGWIEQED